jgi:hypothetical protein
MLKNLQWLFQQRHSRGATPSWLTFSVAYSHIKWRHIRVPHAGRRTTKFFSSLLV